MSSRPQTRLAVAIYWLVMAALAHLHVFLFLGILAVKRDFAFSHRTWYLFWAALAIALPAASCVTCQSLIRWRQYRGKADNGALIKARYASFLALVVGATVAATLYAFGSHEFLMLVIAIVLGASFVALRFGMTRPLH